MVKYVSEKIRKKSGARLSAVQAIYTTSFTDVSVDELITNFQNGDIGRYAIEEDVMTGEHIVELEEMDKPYFETLVRGVLGKKEDLENSLRGYLKEASTYEHMNTTMQALLLCAVYELAYTTEIDTKVIIQEYVDLAYAFFIKNEPKMVNAILDQIAKNIRL
jgi:N utilization substance protein B